MAIGYSYSDHYINHMIMQAADERGLELFIIDPKGVAVLDKQNPKNPIRVPNDLMASLNRHIIGASQRPINVTFGHDPVEHGKIMRFFAK